VASTIDSPSAIVVRDTRTGETLRELANSTAGERFWHLAVSTDGTVYFSRQKPYSRGEEEGTEFEVLSVPKTGGEVRTFARGRSPAVSPDGQYLAMVGAPLEVLCPKEPLVVIDLSTGARRTWHWAGDESGDGNSECGGVHEMSWSPDSQKLVFARQLFEESVEIRILDLSRPEGTILDAELIGGLKKGWRAATFRTNNTLLLAERSDPEHYSRLVEVDLGTGVASTVREFAGSNIVSLAVDSSNENIVVTLHRDEPRKFEGVLITRDGLVPLGDGLTGFHWLDQP
jgi:dipeptidyl aminopeptidase/acylaminoacyl peptidase